MKELDNINLEVYRVLEKMFNLPSGVVNLNLYLCMDSRPELTITYHPNKYIPVTVTKQYEIRELS